MEKPHFKCILLVLASDNTPLYRYFKKAYLAYANYHPDVKIFFTYGSGTQFEPQEHDLVYPEIPESYTTPNMAMKTVNAFEYIDQNFTYDFLVRTNISTFWMLDRLVNDLDKLPKTKCLAGKMGYFAPPFITGIGMFLSSDLIPEIVKNKSTAIYKYHKYVAEDRMISDFFSNHLHIQPKEFIFFHMIEHLTSLDKIDAEIEKGLNKGCSAFRIKNFRGNRELIDTEIVRRLCKKIYGIDIGEYNAHV